MVSHNSTAAAFLLVIVGKVTAVFVAFCSKIKCCFRGAKGDFVLPALASSLFVCAGCSNSAQVGGSISHQGQPVAEVEVSLESVADKTRRFTGITREDGKLFVSYREDSGMPVGRYKIRVKQFTQRDGQPLPAGEEGQTMREAGDAIGKQYLFEHDFSAGNNVLELKLEDAIEVTALSGDEF